MSTNRVLTSAVLFVVSSAICTAQNIAPAHSGTVHYFDGDVTVDGTKLVSQVARFTELKEQSVLHTGLGRAEILLTPGVILRVGENSSIKMLDNRLMSTRVEFLSGMAMLEGVETDTSLKDPAVTIIYKDFEAQPLRNGIIEMSSQPSRVRVFKGEAKVTGNGTSVNVKDGNLLDLTMTMALAKFDTKDADDLYLWSRDRSAYLSAGNMASAQSLVNSGYGNSVGCGSSVGYGNGSGYVSGLGYGSGLGYAGGLGYGSGLAYPGWNPAMWSGFNGGWYYNQCMNMYSYLPFAGTMYSPFGYGFFNPMTIGYAYMPNYYWPGAGGSRTGTTTGLPLPTLPTSTSGTLRKPQPLPHLGTTASLRPSLVAPVRSTGSGLSSIASVRNSSRPATTSLSSGVAVNAVSTVSAAPAAMPVSTSPSPGAARGVTAGGRR